MVIFFQAISDSKILKIDWFLEAYKPVSMSTKCDSTVPPHPSGSDAGSERDAGKESAPENTVFKCLFCDYNATVIVQVRDHMRNAHRGLVVYSCFHANCSFMTHKRSSYMSHQMGTAHALNKPFHCDLCDFNCVTKYILEKHQESSHPGNGERYFTCDVCAIQFDKRAKYNFHIKAHSKDKLYSCTACNISYRCRKSFLNHMKTTVHDGDEKPYKCDLCQGCFKLKAEIVQHMKNHIKRRSMFCGHCDFTAPKEEELLIHVKSHQQKVEPVSSGDNSEVNLNVLQRSNNNPHNLQELSHQDGHFEKKIEDDHNKTKKVHRCNICNKTFTRAGSLRLHAPTHSTVKPFSCGNCNYTCNTKRLLKNHKCKLSHQCRECDYKDTSIKRLRIHEKYHSKIYRFSCEICDFKCQSKKVLLKHLVKHEESNPSQYTNAVERLMNPKHRQSKDLNQTEGVLGTNKEDDLKKQKAVRFYLCEICGVLLKASIKNYPLNRHMQQHNGGAQENVKTYSCDLCSYTSKHKFRIRNHKYCHSGEKPLSCKVCHKKFRDPSNLNMHKKIHFNVKPHRCGICGYGCITKDNMRKHILTHNRDTRYECCTCHQRFFFKIQLKKHIKNCFEQMSK